MLLSVLHWSTTTSDSLWTQDVDETSSSSSQWVPGACITVRFMRIVRGKCPRVVLIRDGTNKRLYHEAMLVGDVGTDAVLVWLAGKLDALTGL
jgi:hypothetical protein